MDVNPLAVDWNVQRGLEAYLTVDGKLPFNDGVFDGAIMDNVLEHIPDPAPLLLEVRRVLKPQAVFLVGVPGIKGYAADTDHKVFYDEVKLKTCLSRNGFSLVRVFWMPWRWKLLDSKFKYYFLYGVFHLTKA